MTTTKQNSSDQQQQQQQQHQQPHYQHINFTRKGTLSMKTTKVIVKMIQRVQGRGGGFTSLLSLWSSDWILLCNNQLVRLVRSISFIVIAQMVLSVMLTMIDNDSIHQYSYGHFQVPMSIPVVHCSSSSSSASSYNSVNNHNNQYSYNNHQNQYQNQHSPILHQANNNHNSLQNTYSEYQQVQQHPQQQHHHQPIRLVVIGSCNVDTFLPVDRLPIEGENIGLRTNCQPQLDIPGGKGCTQAIAASKLLLSNNTNTHMYNNNNNNIVQIVTQLGNDIAGGIIYNTLYNYSVPILGYTTLSRIHPTLSTGRGYVFTLSTGQVSAIVSGGTNMYGWDIDTIWQPAYENYCTFEQQQQERLQQEQSSTTTTDSSFGQQQQFQPDDCFPDTFHQLMKELLFGSSNSNSIEQQQQQMKSIDAIMLQCEIPDIVNTVIALYIRHYSPTTIIVLDIGGEDRMVHPTLLQLSHLIIPNETELYRLYKHYYNFNNNNNNNSNNNNNNGNNDNNNHDHITTTSTSTKKPTIPEMVQYLLQLFNGQIGSILVTQGRFGSTFFGTTTNTNTNRFPTTTTTTTSTLDVPFIHHQPASCVIGPVVDETGAGDCYRSAFVTQILRCCSIHDTTTTTTSTTNQLKRPLLSFLSSSTRLSRNNDNDSDNEQQEDNEHTSFRSIIHWCMEYASAAGACAVEVHGAIPSTPTHEQIMARVQYNRNNNNNNLLQQQKQFDNPENDNEQFNLHQQENDHADIEYPINELETIVQENDITKHSLKIASTTQGGGIGSSDDYNTNVDDTTNDTNNNINTDDDDVFPFLIGSRLNSMKDRPDLWIGHNNDNTLQTPYDYVKRQAQVHGLTCIDFNYPQHFPDGIFTVEQARDALQEFNLHAGAVCLRYPSPKYTRGAMNHPDCTIRNDAIQLTIDAARTAVQLGCNEVVVWSAYDGYDYPFQVDYDTMWEQLVDAFQQCCDAYPTVKFSIEYKPTDENTRFFTVPSTGAACLLVEQVNRTNFGLTLDVGHMLMSGENPGQSIAMAGRLVGTGKLFGIQLNDGYTRLAAEDGLMFGSIHPSMALEIMYQLRKIQFNGHLYFDTFPQRTDPIAEAEYNIRRVKAFWKASGLINKNHIRSVMDNYDAIGALEIVNDALRTT